MQDSRVNKYALDRETTPVEDFVFSVPPEMKSAYTRFRDGWLVVYIKARSARELKPFAKMRAQIKSVIMREKVDRGFSS